MKNFRLTILLISFVAITPAVNASDGVVEINQTCATQLGCFSGDAAGFPITINGTAGKSYRLTSDLIPPNNNTDGIIISSNDIHLDLNGFSIMNAACVGATADCTPSSGRNDGVSIPSFTVYGVIIKNGSIIGMGNNGIDSIGKNGLIEHVQIRWNRLFSIRIGPNSTIKNSNISNNGQSGIRVTGSNHLITDNIIHSNGGYGISGSATTIYSRNSIIGNTSGTVFNGFDMGDNFCETDKVCP